VLSSANNHQVAGIRSSTKRADGDRNAALAISATLSARGGFEKRAAMRESAKSVGRPKGGREATLPPPAAWWM
jgi:hypothetical protein